ncbi:hypothetical protein [Rhodopila sp.]|uniref:carboxylesterase family protein n=1 Tax=Rhodopila sp. TaxID=2480087 RepID=UPI003D149A55
MSGSQTSTSGSAITAGNWITQTINGMQYDVLLPANYNPNIKYPTVLYLHQLDLGTVPSVLLPEVNPWFNSTAFRTDYPAIIVMPLLDQTADPSGNTINFGGVSTADTAGEDNAIAALKQVMATYATDASRIYVTGNSLGGIGTEDMIIKYNAYTGTEGKIFAAALSLAGSDYGQGYPQPNASVVAALKNVPFWAIHGGQDTTVPLAWDQNLYAAEQANGGDMIYTQNNSLGHDVWDTYYPKDGPGSPLGWLFSQSTAGSSATPPASPSPNDTVVLGGSSAAITDASGNAWTITSGAQVAVNGIADATTAGVTELAYVGGTVWQENGSKLWWGKTTPDVAWSPNNGTTVSPLPAPPKPSPNDTVVLAGSSAAISDASGNLWTISSDAQVAVNGVADATTAGVTELAYVGGTVWQENGSKLWWGKTTPDAAWSPNNGTAVSPLPAPPKPSPNDTVVLAGSSAAITDASGNAWTITSGAQVAVNGIADATTGGVTELAYVGGTLWQENASKLWWGKTTPAAAWSPNNGTAASPLPVVASPNDSVVYAGTTTALTDAAGNLWTITSGGTVSLNGASDATTANVTELAYVNRAIWQQNSAGLWWDKTSPTAAWSPTAGTSASPLPAPIIIAAGTASTTVGQSQVSVIAASGNHMLFISGSGDTVSLTGGTDTVTDTGSGNVYVLPRAGNGSDTFTSDILTGSDRLDLRSTLAATNWNGLSSTLSSYLSVTDMAHGATLSVAATPGGAAAAVATIDGATTASLTTLLEHMMT